MTAFLALTWLREHNALVRFESDGSVSVTVNARRRRRATLELAIAALEEAIVAPGHARSAPATAQGRPMKSDAVGTCQHCGWKVTLNAEGYIGHHSWPKPTRQVCPGSTYSSSEDMEQAIEARR